MRIVVLLMLAALAVPTFAQSGEVLLDIGNDSGGFGDTVRIPINIAVTGQLPSTIVFKVNFDVIALAFQSYTLGSIVPTDKSVTAELGPTGITFVMYGGTSTIASGLLMTLRFTVLTPNEGETLLAGVNGSASTPQASSIPVTFDNGRVTLGSNGGPGCAGRKSFDTPRSVFSMPLASNEKRWVLPESLVPEGAVAVVEVPKSANGGAQEVLIPLPAGVLAVRPLLFDGGQTWWSWECVADWLAEPPAVVSAGGQHHLRLLVLHEGIVAVMPADTGQYTQAGMLGYTDVLLLLAVAVVLLAWRRSGRLIQFGAG